MSLSFNTIFLIKKKKKGAYSLTLWEKERNSNKGRKRNIRKEIINRNFIDVFTCGVGYGALKR